MVLWMGIVTQETSWPFKSKLPMYLAFHAAIVSISWLVLLGFYVKPYAERIQFFYVLLHLIQSKGFKSTFLIVTISVVPHFPFLFSHTIKYESK